ncbi:hypothetical protein ACFQ02_01380 [Seminibacterium arietis]|uniref:Uncharacterized protein n=1 Tax=Seminibacterium arietis TaxID=1173502 RepID=A0ABW3I6P1_9PAST
MSFYFAFRLVEAIGFTLVYGAIAYFFLFEKKLKITLKSSLLLGILIMVVKYLSVLWWPLL